MMLLLFRFLLSVTLTLAAHCPSTCRCGNQMTTVQCVDQVLFEIPRLPAKTEKLTLSNIFLGPNLETSLGYLPSLTHVDLSRNIIVRVSNTTFRGLHNLTRVDLSDNRIRTVGENVFQDNPQLEVLDLSGNGLYSLDEAFYKHLPRLRELYLARNNFFTLRLGLRFQVLNQLQILDLSFNDFGDVSTDAFENVHRWRSIVHRKLCLANCKISSVENGTFVPLRGLYDLDLSGVTTLDAGNLSVIMTDLQETNVRYLHMAAMQLTDVDTIFTSAPRLAVEVLDLSHNQIESAAPNAFANLGSVKTLDISHNNIKLLPAAFTTLGNLNTLDISHNKLQAFSGPAVAQLSKLEVLIARNNQFDLQSSLQLDPLQELRVLDLSHNTLDMIVTAGGNAKLEELILVSNNITSLDVIPESVNLKVLNISGNKLTALGPYTFSSSVNIETVDLSYNEISEIDHLAFLPNSSIPYNINLSGNKLTKIRFGGWGSARMLNFSHNSIAEVDFHAFLGMNNLEILDLSYNSIKKLEDETFGYLINLETLNIAHNNLLTTSQQNQIRNTFSNLISLKTIDLSYNSLGHLDAVVFEGNPDMETVSLSNNRFPMIPSGLLNHLKKLQELDIAANPFICSCDLLPLVHWLKRARPAIADHSALLNCTGPPDRVGKRISDFSVGFLECDQDLLELIVFASLGGLTIIVGIIGTVVCRLYHKWSDGVGARKEKEKKRLKKKDHKVQGTCTVEELPLEVLDELDLKMKKKQNRVIANGGPVMVKHGSKQKHKPDKKQGTGKRDSSRSRSKSRDKTQSRSRSKSRDRSSREKRERDRLRGLEKELRYMMSRYNPTSRWDAEGRDRWATMGGERAGRREHKPERADRYLTMPSYRRPRQTLLDDRELHRSEYSRINKHPYSPQIHRQPRPRYSQDDMYHRRLSPYRYDIVRAPRRSDTYDPRDFHNTRQSRTPDPHLTDLTNAGRDSKRTNLKSTTFAPGRQERHYVELPFPDTKERLHQHRDSDLHRNRSYGSIDFKAKKRRFEEDFEKGYPKRGFPDTDYTNREVSPDWKDSGRFEKTQNESSKVEADIHSEKCCRTPDPDYPMEDTKLSDWI